MIQEGRVRELPDLFPTLLDAVPGNLFQVFVAGENALLILAVLGVVFGLALRFDREITSPVSLVAESANRVLYRVNGWIVEIMGVLLIAPGALAIAELRGVEVLRIFAPLLIVVVSAALFTALVVYPIVLLVVNRNRNRPLAWLQHMIPVGFSALMGADVFFALGTTTRIAAENLGLTRRAGALVLPGAALFCRAGSALVSVSAFLVVVRSYTALELGFADAMQLIVAGVLYSTILVRYPTGAVVLLLGYLAGRYGEGMEESYLILLPVIPVLERIAAWLDAMTTGFIAELIGRRGGYTREIERTI
jgi:Na+/H+-dicarboxylate symporter